MKPRQFLLAGLTVVTLIAAFLLKPEPVRMDAQPPQMLAPSLKAQLNDVDEVTVRQGDDSVTVFQDEFSVWRVKDKHDYRAATPELRKLLLNLAHSEIRAEKTDDPDKLARVRLQDNTAHHVIIKRDGETLHHILLGEVSNDKISTFIRYGDSNQSYTTGGSLMASAIPIDWVFPDLFSINRKRVKKIFFAFDGAKDYRYVREKPGEYMTLEPVEEDKKLKNKLMPLNPSYYFERLVFTDVMPADQLASSESTNVTRMESFGGLVVEATFHDVDLEPWVAYRAYVDPELRDESIPELPDLSQLQAEADAINDRVGAWVYKPGTFNLTQLRKSYFELVSLK